MKPLSPRYLDQTKLFHSRLDRQIEMTHELVRLSTLIDWGLFDYRFSELYHADKGSPFILTRLMVGLLYLNHIYKPSDEQLVIDRLENSH